MMRQIVEVADKAVSTDDLTTCDPDALKKSILDVARLEAVLSALVENKVVAIRTENEKTTSNHSSPIALLASRIHRRFQSNSTVSSEKLGKHKLSVDNVRSVGENNGEIKDKDGGKGERRRPGGSRQRSVETADPESGLPSLHDECERKELVGPSDRSKKRGRHKERSKDGHGDMEGREGSDDRDGDPPARSWHEREPCLLPSSPDRHGADACSVVSECVVVLERERTCTRTRTRARRKRRRRRRARALLVEAIEERVKVLDPDELPQRARWTIMVTACLLLFLCLLLVGVTLRMAPLIDDMVRQENERMMHESLNIGTANNTQPMAAQRTSTGLR